MTARIGMCHLCGERRTLTYEHVPPKRLFNARSVALHTIETAARTLEFGEDNPRTEVLRRGMGRTALCEQCNQATARYYGDAFVDWTCQALGYSGCVSRDRYVFLPYTIKPLNVVKQALTMLLVATDFAGPKYHVELRAFARDPGRRHIPTKYRVYTYLIPLKPDERPPGKRLSSYVAILDTQSGRRSDVPSEVAFPPLGYCLSMSDPGRETDWERQLTDITSFGDYEYDYRQTVWLRLPCRIPVGGFPLQYAK